LCTKDRIDYLREEEHVLLLYLLFLYIFHNLCKNVSIDLIIAREDVKHCCDEYEMMNMNMR
jgi:hypothetical protein